MHRGWNQLQSHDKAVCCLRRFVLARSRSRLHCPAAGLDTATRGPVTPAAGEAAVVSAVRGLPRRQREALVLRHYLSLPDGQIAAVMGISRGAVRVHSARGMAALRRVL